MQTDSAVAAKEVAKKIARHRMFNERRGAPRRDFSEREIGDVCPRLHRRAIRGLLNVAPISAVAFEAAKFIWVFVESSG